MLLCVKCTAEIPDDSVFCPRCGKKQAPPASANRRVKTHGNGTGYVYKRGKTYTICKVVGWKTVEGKDGTLRQDPIRIYKGGFRTKKDAYDYLPQMRREAAETVHTLASLWATYSSGAMEKLSESKQTHYRIAFRRLTEIAYTNISNLTIDDLQDVITRKAQTYYPAKDVRDVLSHLYKLAMAQQAVTTNLSQFLVLPDNNEKETVPFTVDEITTLTQAFFDGYFFAGYVLLMIYTGMMPGELCDLRTDMIDLEARTITGVGKKTKKRKETPMVLADNIIPVLTVLISRADGDNLLPMSRDQFYAEFKKMIKTYQLNPALQPYSGRHTTATALKMQGVPQETIREIMRHAKSTMTDHYIHGVNTSALLNAVNELDFQGRRKS